MKPIKIAQIGMEHDHAVCAWHSLKKQPETFELVAWAQPNPDYTITDWAKRETEGYPCMTVEEILDIPGLEAVVIETIEHDLTKYALMAAQRGLHVQMDKPGGHDLAEFEELIRTVKEQRLVFQTGYMYRFNPAVKYAMELAKSGKLGDIYAVEAHMDCLHPKTKREWLGQYKGGMMFFLGCHLVDLIIQFKGFPDKVIPMNCATGIDGVDSEDYGFALFQYKDGVSFAKTCAAEVNGFERRQLVICGSKGTVEIKPLEKYPVVNPTGAQNT